MKDFIEVIKKQKLEGSTLAILTYLMLIGFFISFIEKVFLAVMYAVILWSIVVGVFWALNKMQVLNLEKTNLIFKIAYLLDLVYVIVISILMCYE